MISADETALFAIISVGGQLLTQRNVKRNSKCWIARRQRKGLQKFFKDVHMYNNSFVKLLSKVEKHIAKKDTVMREAILASDKLIITLFFLASGETYRNLMYSSKVSESTIAQFISQVCKAIYNLLQDTYLKVPTNNVEWEKIAQDFLELWHVPNTIGALDGKHIPITAPAKAGLLYYNYKSYNSIIMLALVDARKRFIYVDVGVNGRVSDGGVFAQSDLYKALQRNTLNIQADKPLPKRCKPTPCVILADAAFPLKRYLMKPYPLQKLMHEETNDNYRLSRGRNAVENAFGMLANRFRILLRTITLSPEKVSERHRHVVLCTTTFYKSHMLR